MAGKRSKKKKTLTMVILLIVIAALIGTYFVTAGWKDKKDEEEAAKDADDSMNITLIKSPESGNGSDTQSTSVSGESDLSSTTTAVASKDADNVIVLDPDDIKTISVDDTLYSYTLTQTDDKWLVNDDEEFPLNDSCITTIVNKLALFQATSLVVENCDDMAQYGLDEDTLEKAIFNKAKEDTAADAAVIQEPTSVTAASDGLQAATTAGGSIFDALDNEVTDTPVPTQEEETSDDDAQMVRVLITKDDGSTIKILIGDKSSANGGYYVSINDSTTVYTCDYDTRTPFYREETDLLSGDTIAEVDPDDVRSLKIDSDTFDSLNIVYKDTDDNDLTGSNIYPDKLIDYYGQGTTVNVDPTAFSNLMNNYKSITLGDFVDYRSKDLKEYGLDYPKTAVTVSYVNSDDSTDTSTDTAAAETKDEYTLYFGNMDETGENYYVRLDGSNLVYLLDAKTASSLLDVDVFSLIEKYTQLVNIAMLSDMKLTINNGTSKVIDYAITQTTTTSDAGSETTSQSFKKDGVALSDDEADSFRDLYQKIIGLKLNAVISKDAIVDYTSPVFEIAFSDTEGNTAQTVGYYTISGDNADYAVKVNDDKLFTADKESVDAVITDILAQ
jgi:hypothetical protein